MNTKVKILLGVVVVLLLVYWVFFRNTQEEQLTYTVTKNNLVLSITSSGELEAKSAVPIMGPEGLRNIRIWQIKIDDLIEEGTVVKKGDFVAALSQSEVIDRLKSEETEYLKSESQFTQTRLDTTIELNQARNEIKNLEYALKEQEIVLEQSIYEPPATIRQAENQLEKSKKALQDAIKNYSLKLKKARARMQEVEAGMTIAKRKIEEIEKILGELTINAPDNGMVEYKRDWDGKKYTIGSMIGTWSPVVATLPDLSSMISKTFVNEVDISKVKVGQKVNIILDAFPDKKLTGKVTKVSNVGQKNPNSDGKVFEVDIELDKVDSDLRPAMTTSNTIIQNELKDVLSVPIDAVFNSDDSLFYVFKKENLGITKQQVLVGQQNETLVEILKGLNLNDKILLSAPEKAEDISITPLKSE